MGRKHMTPKCSKACGGTYMRTLSLRYTLKYIPIGYICLICNRYIITKDYGFQNNYVVVYQNKGKMIRIGSYKNGREYNIGMLKENGSIPWEILDSVHIRLEEVYSIHGKLE